MSKKIAGYGVGEWKIAGAIFALGIAAAGFFIFSGESVEDRDERERMSYAASAEGAALLTCQREIKLHAKDVTHARIPGVSRMQGGEDWRFLWSNHTEQVHVRNDLGLDVAVNALCVVDAVSKKIKLLTIDGKQLIPLASA